MKVRRFYPLQVLHRVLTKEGELTRAETALHAYAAIRSEKIHAMASVEHVDHIGNRIIWGGCLLKCGCTMYTGQKTGICMTVLTSGLAGIPVGRCGHGPDEHDRTYL